MAIDLPSKNVITVLCACTIVLSGVAIAKHVASKGDLQAAQTLQTASSTQNAAFALVEKALMAEADDSIKALGNSATSSETTAASSTPEKLTATEAFSQTVLNQYVAAKHQKGTLTDQDIKTLVGNILRTPLSAPGAQIYARGDIKSFEATPAELHEYGTALVKAFQANISQDLGRELYIVNDILESKDSRKAAKLNAISLSYKKMIDATLALKTPDILADSVLDYINSLSEFRLIFENMGEVLSDPILAVRAINDRDVIAEEVIANLKTIGALLKTHGVIYMKGEKGGVLFE